MSDKDNLICGFWDEPGTLAGLAWRLGGQSGGLLLSDEKVSTATAALADTDAGVEIGLEADGRMIGSVLTPVADPVELGGAAGKPTAAPCSAAIGGNGAGAAGQVTRWTGAPGALLRHFAAPAGDGTLIVVLSTGDGAGHHSEEATAAWMLRPDGSSRSFAEALLSTEYDDAGRQSRAGIELWAEEEESPPTRAAGTRLGEPVEPAGGVSPALVGSSVEGSRGVGSYLIWRAG